MAERPKKKKDPIDGIKESLYSRAHEPHIDLEARTPLSPDIDEAPAVGWANSKIAPLAPQPPLQEVKKGISLPTKFFIGSLFFFVCAAGFAGYIFYKGENTISSENIDIQVVAPSVIDGGKASTFEIIITNRNQSRIDLADLSLDYPQNTRSAVDQTQQLLHDRQTIGTIEPGQQIKRTANAVFYGSEGSEQKVKVTLQYSIPNSNSIYQREAQSSFLIGSSPVSIKVNAPSEAISDQAFGIDVTVTSNSKATIKNIELEAKYPFGYSSVSANPAPDVGSLWRLGTLEPGQSKTIHLQGKIIGQDGDERLFQFLTGSDADTTNSQVKIPFIVVPQTLTVHKPFITATLALNSNTSPVVPVQAGQTVTGTVVWQNNLSVPVSNMQLVLSFSGQTLDKNTISSPNAFYQSVNNTLTWSSDQDQELSIVPPGGTGTFTFYFTTLKPGSNGTVYTNPTVNVSLAISGVRQGQSGVPEQVASAASSQAQIASAVSLGETALHFTGPFQNAGPMPPVAEQRTTYTVVWTVSNSSNTIANTVVSATLPPYVQYVAGQDSAVSFEKSSRTVTWALGDVKAGAGFSLPARTNAFQVTVLPSRSQIGQVVPLTSVSKLSAQDRFAQVSISESADPATTELPQDPQFISSMGTVVSK